MLSKDGQLQRSYSYIRFSWECKSIFQREYTVGRYHPYLSTIDKSYQTKVFVLIDCLLLLVTGISIISLFVSGAFVLYQQTTERLAETQSELRAQIQIVCTNTKLLQSERWFDCTNNQLSATNGQLSAAVNQLNESNRVRKKEYIIDLWVVLSLYRRWTIIVKG